MHGVHGCGVLMGLLQGARLSGDRTCRGHAGGSAVGRGVCGRMKWAMSMVCWAIGMQADRQGVHASKIVRESWPSLDAGLV